MTSWVNLVASMILCLTREWCFILGHVSTKQQKRNRAGSEQCFLFVDKLNTGTSTTPFR